MEGLFSCKYDVRRSGDASEFDTVHTAEKIFCPTVRWVAPIDMMVWLEIVKVNGA